jgi:hypothetical protein
MCIRALDYCPPVDLTFGDYLRALVTADVENDPTDDAHERVAFVEAFRRHGIVPEDVRALSIDGLLWRPTSAAPDEDENVVLEKVGKWAEDIPSWHLTRDRRALFDLMRSRRAGLHEYLRNVMRRSGRVLGGIDPQRPFEVHSIRPCTGSDWHGRPTFRWIIELTQSDAVHLDPDGGGKPDAVLHGGCTLVVDGRSGRVRYTIRKPLDDARRARQLNFLRDRGADGLAATYFTGTADEPFAVLHRR